jgi:hypothetical protein
MKLLRYYLVLLILAISLTACNKTLKPEELPAHIVTGDDYYTQFVIRYEKGVHLTTNYRRGASIPVNTRVKLLSIKSKTIEVQPDNMVKPLLIKNAKKHTGDDVIQAFDKLFGKQKVNLRRFSARERKHIRQGTVGKGMRKKAVLVAIGYPPITETPSLDMNTWTYWSSRFNRFRVHFRNGIVYKIVN